MIRLFIIVLVCVLIPCQDAPAYDREVNLGILLDARDALPEEVLKNIENELSVLLGTRYDIRIPQDKVLEARWSLDAVQENLERLMNDPDVDIIVGLGLLTSSVIPRRKSYAKPVIAVGFIDPEMQGLPPAVENTSGVHNLTYILVNRSVVRDVVTFYDIYPYKRLGIIFYGEMLKMLPVEKLPFIDMVDKDAEIVLLPVTDSIDEVFVRFRDVDALYLGYLGPFEGTKEKLIHEINARGIPSFGYSVADVSKGVLAAISPEGDISRIVRRISLDVEAILDGTDPADLPVNLTFEENLVLNMQTARDIGFSPKFSVIAQAELINEAVLPGSPAITLQEVMRGVVSANLDLIIEKANIEAARKEVSLARSDFLPSLTIGGTGQQVDKDRAKASFGQQSERTVSASATLEQLIFSEQAMGNVTARKHLLTASQYIYEQVKLDVVLDAAIAYFNVLKAKTGHKIQKDNVELTRRNLEISRQREAVGYSGRADVYRWESRLASASTSLLEAKNTIDLTKIQLNQLLNRPLDAQFRVEETSLSNSVFGSYRGPRGRDYIDNPVSLEIFTKFMIEEAVRQSPEVGQLDANIAALDRTLTSFKRERFVPSLVFGAQSQHVVSRDGIGSDVAGLDYDDDTWNASVNLTLPLFSGGSTGINIEKTTIEINRLKDQRARLTRDLELNVRQALLDLCVKTVNLKSSRRSADLSEKSLSLVQDEYSKGKISIVDLVDAQNNALNKNLAALDSEYDFMISILKTQRAMGKFILSREPHEQEDFWGRFEGYLQQHTR